MSNNSDTKSERYYGNFTNPIGLAIRLLISGNSIAYHTLAREIARPLLSPIDRLMQRKELSLLVDTKEIHQPILLIVGPPRSGSTLLNLALSQALEVSWFPNVSQLFPRSPIVAARWFANQTKKQFRLSNYYGNTPGLALPNDGYSIWNRWYDYDRYVPRMSASSVDSMRLFMAAWINSFEKPLLNKNNRNSLCIQQLSEVLPTAHFIVISRHHADNARSLVRSREFVQGSKHKPWGLLSHADHKDDELGYIEDICDQLFQIRAQMSAELSAVDPTKVTEVRYEDFCDDPLNVVSSIASRARVNIRDEGIQALSTIRKSNSRLLLAEEERRLSECLIQYGLN